MESNNHDRIRNLVTAAVEETVRQDAGGAEIENSRWRRGWLLNEAADLIYESDPGLSLKQATSIAKERMLAQLQERGTSVRESVVSDTEVSFITGAARAWLVDEDSTFVPVSKDAKLRSAGREEVKVTEIPLSKAYRLKDLAAFDTVKDEVLSFGFAHPEKATRALAKLVKEEQVVDDERFVFLLDDLTEAAEVVDGAGEPIGMEGAIAARLEKHKSKSDFVSVQLDRGVYEALQPIIAASTGLHTHTGGVVNRDGVMSFTAFIELHVIGRHANQPNSATLIVDYVESGLMSENQAEQWLELEEQQQREIREAYAEAEGEF